MNRILPVIVLLWLMVPSARAQGVIEGTVADASGIGVPGVSVTITRDPDFVWTAITDTAGRYRGGPLNPGTYHVTFNLSGYRIPSRGPIVVESARVQVDVTAGVNPCPDARTGEECIADASMTPMDWAGVSCERISLTGHGGLVSEPRANYTVEFAAGGRAALKVLEATGRTASYSAVVEMPDFNRLCLLVRRLGFESMSPGYVAPAYDHSGFAISVTFEGREKTVRDEGFVGPIELRAIRDSIEIVRRNLDWKPR